MLPFIQRIKQPPRPNQLPPCFNDDKGDIIISMLYVTCPLNIGTVQMRISSDKLLAVSPYFATTLKPEWLHNKVTGNEDCGDGTFRVMKRYELELDDDGKDVLVGKTTTTDPGLWFASALSITSSLNKASTLPMQHRAVASRLNVVSTVNLLGFSMLCGFPSSNDRLILDRLQRMQTLPMNDIVQRLLGWMDYYGTLTNMRERLIWFITSELLVGDIQRSILFYLRIACVLRDSSFFSWVLDKNPFFSNDIWLRTSSLDTRLGLDPWTSAFERRLNLFGSVFRGLRNLPELIMHLIPGPTADDWKLMIFAWNSWLLDRAADSQAKYEHINPSILALHSIASSKEVVPYYNHTSYSTSGVTARHHLRQALIMAKEEIARHITVDESEPFGFRINDYDSFPWDFRIDEDTDEMLLNLITTSDLCAVEEDLVEEDLVEEDWIAGR